MLFDFLHETGSDQICVENGKETRVLTVTSVLDPREKLILRPRLQRSFRQLSTIGKTP